jgi:hypothetical protein
MKRGLLVVIVGCALVAAVGASAAAKTVTATLSGKCTEIDTLDHNGALASARNNCATTAKGRFAGATQLALGTFEKESGTGAGLEHGTLVATGLAGLGHLNLHGKRPHDDCEGDSVHPGDRHLTLGKVTGTRASSARGAARTRRSSRRSPPLPARRCRS